MSNSQATTSNLLHVNSQQLDDAVKDCKRPRKIPRVGVTVSASQLRTAARLLREAEPTICNGQVSERPGFISAARQDDPKVLLFEVGIIPSTDYRIDRRGRVLA